jgi:diacylglycerol kinase family enzyme
LSLSTNIAQLVRGVPQMTPLRIALGRGNERYFVMMAGIGVDAEIIYELRADIKQSLGELGFWLEAFRHWTQYHFRPFSVTVSAKPRKATFAVLGRGAWYAGGVKITSRAALTMDCFDLCLFKGKSRLDYLRYLAGVMAGSHLYFHDVEYQTVQSVEMSADYPIRVQMDGENAGFLPMTFQIIPDALTLLVPTPDACNVSAQAFTTSPEELARPEVPGRVRSAVAGLGTYP